MKNVPVFRALPRFPAVFRDLSFVVRKDIAYAIIEDAIWKCGGPLLESIECVDVFSGKGIAKDRRSIAFSMVFRAPDRTLASDDVNSVLEQIIQQLSIKFGAELRSS